MLPPSLAGRYDLIARDSFKMLKICNAADLLRLSNFDIDLKFELTSQLAGTTNVFVLPFYGIYRPFLNRSRPRIEIAQKV